MEQMKKSWETPQLIILARGNPEENVLLVCKAIGFTGVSPYPQAQGQTACNYPEAGNCGACQNRGGKDS